MREVARRYRFRGSHHVPCLPEPWCNVHEHAYTVEVVARGDGAIVVDTDLLDAAWEETGPSRTHATADLDEIYAPENTTVEALAAIWLADFREWSAAVCRVVVWEDDERWGAAE